MAQQKSKTKTVPKLEEWKTYLWEELEEHVRMRMDVVHPCQLTVWEMEQLIPLLEQIAKKKERLADRMLTQQWHESTLDTAKRLKGLADRLNARLRELYQKDKRLKP